MIMQQRVAKLAAAGFPDDLRRSSDTILVYANSPPARFHSRRQSLMQLVGMFPPVVGAIAVVALASARNIGFLYTPQQEELRLRRGVDVGLINATNGRIDSNPDGIPPSCHKSIVELSRAHT